MGVAGRDRGQHVVRRRMMHEVMADLRHRRLSHRPTQGARTTRTPGPTCPAARAAASPRRASRRSGCRRRARSAAGCPARPPSRCRNGRRRSRSRRPRRRTASSRPRAPPDAPPRSGDIGPGSDADVRSGGRAAASGRRAEFDLVQRAAGRPAGPSASTWPASAPRPGARSADFLRVMASLLAISSLDLIRSTLNSGMPDAKRNYVAVEKHLTVWAVATSAQDLALPAPNQTANVHKINAASLRSNCEIAWIAA